MAQQDFQERVFLELTEQEPASRRAALAELSAILGCIAREERDGGERTLTLQSSRPEAWNKCFTLLKKAINITVEIDNAEDVFCFCGDAAERIASLMQPPERMEADEKCLRSFLAGQFLCTGSIRDPLRDYYLSFEILSETQAEQTLRFLKRAGILLKRTDHGKGHVLMTRDSGVIVDVLNLLGAHVCMMDMENARIMKQMRGRINRKVNCETANIMKTVAASRKQLEQIQMIRESSIWETLPESLQQMALLREKFPESSLQELGEMLEPPVGKSGVNHRLRRLAALAEELQKRNTGSQGEE